MKKIYAAAIALLIASSAPVNAAPPGMYIHIYNRTFQNPVEQQTPGGATQPDRSLWVINDTDCAWDVDDDIAVALGGRLRPGESANYTDCVILDAAGHLVGLDVSEGLSGSISIDGVEGSYFAGWTHDTDCLLTPEYGEPEYLSLPVVSNGHGDRATVTWTVTNTSSKVQTKARAIARLTWDTLQQRAYWGCP